MKRFFILTALLVSTVFSFNAFACGDSLYRVGKGVSYRVYTAPLPGNVLVYGQSESAKQLAEELARSGHGVLLVDNELELGIELQKGSYDVVIAPYSEHRAIESTAKNSTATYLPVALNSEEEKTATQDYSKVMLADRDGIKSYLKAIHKTLKSKV